MAKTRSRKGLSRIPVLGPIGRTLGREAARQVHSVRTDGKLAMPGGGVGADTEEKIKKRRRKQARH